MVLRIAFQWSVIALLCVVLKDCYADDRVVFFQEQVVPILQKRCYPCHSHHSKMEGGLALDWRSGWEAGGSRGPAIAPSDSENSLLVTAIRHLDSELKMPEQRLPEKEIQILVQWVDQGAFDDRKVQPLGLDPQQALQWWSLKPLSKPNLPAVSRLNPIDCVVLDKLHQVGVEPSPTADRKTLIRRVTYDLTGLPPEPEDLDRFLKDPDARAYENLVDRLLHSDRYGERWARHWLDTIHFAESHGYEHDVGRDNAWRFRDYVIQALNTDLPWQEFVQDQLAADYFHPGDSRRFPALGFLGAGTFDLSTYSTATVTFDYLARDDLVNQTMSAFVSTTANCARCHSHKFDPITQEDYYALQAVFAGVIKGDVAYDADSTTTTERTQLQAILDAAINRDARVLLSESNRTFTELQASQFSQSVHWQPLEYQTYLSDQNTPLTRQPNNVILAGGKAPDKETYTVTATCGLERITAIRLDLHVDETLPGRGPGRAGNGNMHLCEFEVRIFDAENSQPKLVKMASAAADFNQADWGIERAIDGDPQTAWGINPAEGKPHHALFVFDEAIPLKASTHLAITLRQLHGRSHVIGAFSLSATSADTSKLVAFPYEVEQAMKTASQERSNEQWLTLAAHFLSLDARQRMQALPAPAYVYAAGKSVLIPNGYGKTQPASIASPKTIHVLHRGDFDKPRAEIGPGALTVLNHQPPRFTDVSMANEVERRAALANWIVHRDNPLTWRSIVNRVWHYHFGRGLCETPSDFGRMGGLPSHPELIDWLAVWFRDEAKGSLKQLHRLIVTSQTYQQSSAHRPEAEMLDSDNRFMWRQNRQRIDADSYRDFVLAISGNLDLTMGGPSVQYFSQSKGPQSTPVLDYQAYDWSKANSGRRSIYRYVWRGIADPLMEALDFPDLGLLAPQRSFSVSSLQSLALINDRFVLHHSQHMADQIVRSSGDSQDIPLQIHKAVQLAWCRAPTSPELEQMKTLVSTHSLAALCRVLFNSNEFLFID
jgi:Protein of unknown function (DUF1553)/Protein of unknown function (DUF1549)/Planctomycete cytochrome C